MGSQGKDRTRFIDWSSLRRENPSNRNRKDSLDGFLLSSFLRIFHFEFPAKRYVETLKKKESIGVEKRFFGRASGRKRKKRNGKRGKK